ncbi:MAG: hypothetical protein QF412_14130 [Planctomycetota bacterium]|nr:hypothetical protein [Planctomycetota bacterium]
MLTRVLRGVTLLALGFVAIGVILHWDLQRGFTHTVGVFIVLAELLRDGVFYPASPSENLVYSAFYHPLAFAPLSLLPGSGLGMAPALRMMVAGETLACLALTAWILARSGRRGALSWQPALWALCTFPLTFSLLGMRDDPRACLFSLLAIIAHLHGGKKAPFVSGGLLVLAFMTKATAPLVPGIALSITSYRRGGWSELRRFWVACVAGVAGSIAFLQWGIGCDFLGNGLYYAVFNPAKEPRSWAVTFEMLGNDLTTAGDRALLVLLGVSSVLALARAVRRKFDLWDLLILFGWLKTILVYRSVGTELNHLLDVTLYACLHLGFRLGPVLNPAMAFPLLALMIGVGTPLQLLPDATARRSTLRNGHIAQAAELLRKLPAAPTLCEEPLLAWTAGTRPLVTDPLLTFGTLARYPEIRNRWFGPSDQPGALQRIILMRNPLPGALPDPTTWYGPIHFDRQFLDEVRAKWRVMADTDGVTAMLRKNGQ